MNRILLASTLALTTLLTSCGESADVRIYVALDQEHSERLVKSFEAETGLTVKARYDTEASKTVGLVTAIIEEANHPRCDVFWNNEVAQTANLGQRGLLEPYQSPSAANIPLEFRAADYAWTGFAARARIIIVNTDKFANRSEYPRSIRDFADPKWKGQCGIARPVTGTTLTHFAALRTKLGDEYTPFVDSLFANDVQWLQSNGATMRAVRDGDLAFALTDTDDFHVALSKGHHVACVFPDQDELGTMLIPNSVAIIKGDKNREAARKFVDWVLSEKVEGLLAAARSAQIPVRSTVAKPAAEQILSIGAFRTMRWDPAETAKQLNITSTEFTARQTK